MYDKLIIVIVKKFRDINFFSVCNSTALLFDEARMSQVISLVQQQLLRWSSDIIL